MDQAAIANNVRKLRKTRHWTQEDLARSAGVDVRTVQRAEAANSLGLETLKALAATFDTTIELLSFSGGRSAAAPSQDPLRHMENAHVTSSYVHVQRALDLVGPAYAEPSPQDTIARGTFFSRLTAEVVTWLASNQVRTLGQLLADGKAEVEQVFSHIGAFYFRGMSSYLQHRRREMPDAYARLDDFSSGLRLVSTINPDHLTSNSAPGHLSGQRRVFFVGIISAASDHLIEARPVVIGILVSGLCDGVELGPPALFSMGEIHLSQIDEFAPAADLSAPTVSDLGRLKDISEADVKAAFAQIIGETFVPKDRPDEMSDLVSTRLCVEGRRVSSAFAFKGPAKFHPLTVADMGKNGDQIFRLFNEPAELLIVQHCNRITSAVRAHMRAFATQPGRARMFCLIDGADTIRILRRYGKLGL